MADDTTKPQSSAPTAQPPQPLSDFSPDDEQPLQTFGGKIASAIIVLSALLLAILVVWRTDINPRTDDAEVLANYIGIAPVVNGPLTELNVHDNQEVHAGEVLFRIDDRPYRYALGQATSEQAALEGQIVDESRRIRAQESAAVAAAAGSRSAVANSQRAASAVDEAKAEVAHAEAALATARTEYTYAQNNLRRIEPLLAKQFVTVDQVDQIRTGTQAKQLAVVQAEAQLNVAKATLASSQSALEASQQTISQSQATQQQQQHAVTTLEPLTAQREGRTSALLRARYDLDQCTVRAPFDARVTDLVISQGAYAHAGQQMFTLIDTRVWWVVANFRETQLRHIQPGMHVQVYLMGQPSVLYRGVVDSVGYGVTPDASTVGTLTPGLPDVQRTLSWVHLASRYPVRIRILNPPPGVLRISESAVVVVRGWNG